jgi:Ca2+/Na+ antiporter
MKLRNLFIINIFIAVFFGSSCAFFPHLTYSLYGIVPDNPAIWASRLVGGSILGFATLMWFGIRTASIETRRAIALALFVQDTIGCIASLVFQLTGEVNFFGWLSLALYGVLALAYAYFRFIRPKEC